MQLTDWDKVQADKIKRNTCLKITSKKHFDYVCNLLSYRNIGFWSSSKNDCINKNEQYLHFEYKNDGSNLEAVSVDMMCKGYKQIFIDMPEDENLINISGSENANARVLAEKTGKKHSHYFKDVSNLDTIDVYRICDLCEVDDKSGATQHAIKKLLCAGQRGAKDKRKDLEEARDTIIRKLQMMDEDGE